MKTCRLLLSKDLRATVERMCGMMRCELSIADAEPIWQKQNRRVFRIDLPDFHFRVLEEAAGVKGVSLEALLHTWIEEYAKELEGSGGRMESRFRLVAEWNEMGYTGREGAVRELALKIAKE